VHSDDIHLSAARARQIRMDGICSHRFLNVEPGDVCTRRGMRVTSPLRIVIDLSATLDDSQLGRLVDEFLRRKLLRIEDLHERVSRLKPARGRAIPRLKRVVAHRPADYQPGDSEMESRILRLLAREGFPTPRSQYWVRHSEFKARIDHAYSEVKLYIESGGFGWHQFASDLDGDLQRRDELVTHGWRPLTFSWRMTDSAIIKTMDGVYDRSTGQWRVGAENGGAFNRKVTHHS